MPENDYSKDIKQAIMNFAGSCSDKYYSKVLEGKIWLQAPYSRTAFYKFPYKPEVRLTEKNGEEEHHTIFEVFDSQLKDPNLIIADIIQSILVENTKVVIFIVPSDVWEEKVKELSRVIPAILFDKLEEAIPPSVSEKTTKKIIEDYKIPPIFVYKISLPESKNPQKLQALFKSWSKRDGW